MARSRFLEESDLARPGDPCPICGRPAPGEGREHGVCRISREKERTDTLGRVWHDPRGLRVHCFRVSDPRVPAPGGEGTYEARENPGKEGTFYTLRNDRGKIASRLLRRSDGTAAAKSGRRDAAPTGRVSPTVVAPSPPVNRLEVEWAEPALEEQQLRRRAQARDLWADATPMGLALEYLASRGIDRAWLKRDWPGSLGFRTLVYHAEARRELPAMLCRVTAPDGGHAATHRIYLRADGWGKAEGITKTKALLGSPLGGAVRLYDPAPPGIAEGVLFLCEGVETAMAIAQAVRGAKAEDGRRDAAPTEESALAGAGVWSCLSSSGLVGVVIPSAMVRSGIVSRVVIAADVDQSGGGQRAAENAAAKLRREYPGLRVGIGWPGMGVLTRWDEELGHCVPGRG